MPEETETHEENQKEQHKEKKEEKKAETRTIKIPGFLSLFSRLSSPDTNNDWRFGLAFIGMIVLMYMQTDFIVLAAWMFVWFLFISYLDK